MAEIVEVNKDDMWYLDVGCSNHMSGNKECFINLDESVKKSICFGDNRMVKAEGFGSVKIERSDGKVCTIHHECLICAINEEQLD